MPFASSLCLFCLFSCMNLPGILYKIPWWQAISSSKDWSQTLKTSVQGGIGLTLVYFHAIFKLSERSWMFLLVFPPFSACFWPVFRGRRRNWGGNVQWWWSGGRGWNLSARSPPFSCTIDSLLPRLKSGWMLLPWTTLCRPVWQCYRATKETFDIRDRDDIVILWWYFW